MDEFKRTPIFSFNDVKIFLEHHGSTNNYPKIFIKRMIKSGRVYIIAKGFYTLYKDIEVVGFSFYPFYYGLGFALTKHRLWKQQANPYILTIKNVRRGVRQAFGSNFVVSKISSAMFFGYHYVQGSNFYYPISDIEKTLIDCIYYRFNLEDYVYSNIFKSLDNKKIDKYLKKCNKRVKARYLLLKKTYGNIKKLRSKAPSGFNSTAIIRDMRSSV
jgi:predicted transcriptional regulator of viral defense system